MEQLFYVLIFHGTIKHAVYLLVSSAGVHAQTRHPRIPTSRDQLLQRNIMGIKKIFFYEPFAYMARKRAALSEPAHRDLVAVHSHDKKVGLREHWLDSMVCCHMCSSQTCFGMTHKN